MYSVCGHYVIPRLNRELRFDVYESGCLRDNRNRYLVHRGNRSRTGRSYHLRFVKRAVVSSFIVLRAMLFIVFIIGRIVRSFLWTSGIITRQYRSCASVVQSYSLAPALSFINSSVHKRDSHDDFDREILHKDEKYAVRSVSQALS